MHPIRWLRPFALTLGLGLLAVAVPSADGDCPRSGGSSGDPVALEPGAQSAAPVRLRVETGPESRVDRGRLAGGSVTEVVGSFRYWDEPGGRMLYLYDASQSLLARVVDPALVEVVPVARP